MKHCPRMSRWGLLTVVVSVLWLGRAAWADAPLAIDAPQAPGSSTNVVAPPTAAEVRKSGAHSVNVSVDHTLSREDARSRVEQLLAYWGKRFGVKSAWSGFRVELSGVVWGITIDAHFDVGDHDVMATATDPGFAWRGMAHDYVAKKLKKYLHPAYEEP